MARRSAASWHRSIARVLRGLKAAALAADADATANGFGPEGEANSAFARGVAEGYRQAIRALEEETSR